MHSSTRRRITLAPSFPGAAVAMLAVVFTGVVACGGQSPSASGQTPAPSPDQVASTALSAVELSWQTGIRTYGGGTIEPAVSDTDGSQTFLITPNHSPFYDGSATPDAPIPPPFNKVSAPLYLVTYPMDSTVDSNGQPLNCYTAGFFDHVSTYNCDHAQIPGIKGHDHLVGAPGGQKAGGDYNVPWHVLATFFTPQGISNGAMNTRILTLEQLEAAQAKGDVSPFADTHIYFNCSAVSGAVYARATPVNF